MEPIVVEAAAQMSALQTVLWYFASLFGSLALRAFVATKGKPLTVFHLKTFYSENVVRLWLGLFVTVFFALLMFSSEATTIINQYIPMKVSPAAPVAFGLATALFLISSFKKSKE